MEDRILFIPEVAERLHRSVGQLRHMITDGEAPKSAKIAGRICFRQSDVEKFIADAFEKAS